MTTITKLIKGLRNNFKKVESYYNHPTLYITCTDDRFLGQENNRKRDFVCKTLGIEAAELDLLENITTIKIELISELEKSQYSLFYNKEIDNQHWLPLLESDISKPLPSLKDEIARSIHFYGYKGGQGRSTVLANLAKSLSEDGYRVLAVDVDIEAPSLEYLFDTASSSPTSTVMGLCGWADEILPIAAYIPKDRKGQVDLLSCRPWSPDYDMDFAAFSIRSSLDTSVLSDAVTKLEKFLNNIPHENKYDFILFDHRTGMAASVIPVINSWPGSVVINLRKDGLSNQAKEVFNILLNRYTSYPGAFVNFTLDPEDTKDTLLNKDIKTMEGLLEQLGVALERGADSDGNKEPVPTDILRAYWIGWFHDRSFLTNPNPDLNDISKDNRESLLQLREVLGMSGKKQSPILSQVPSNLPTTLSPSGAVDQGWFIETPDIAKLFQTNSPYNYIFGRKGTGKTRLFRELVHRKFAEPLLAAADYSGGGVKSRSPLFSKILLQCDGDFESFWWTIFSAAIRVKNPQDAEDIESILENWSSLTSDKRRDFSNPSEVVKIASVQEQRRTFVIDGVETAVSAAKLRPFIESLFSFLLAVQSESRISNKINIRLFLRTDLSRRAIQNVEQQIHGRALELKWNSNAIFNFALARIEQIHIFNEQFPGPCQAIRDRQETIKEGKLESEEFVPLLLQIFPQRLKRNNLQTITFLSGYFSDATGDSDKSAAFYPRLFETFLDYIANPEKFSTKPSTAFLEEGRVHQGRILDAHSAAAMAFINEVKLELYVLLELSQDENENSELVDRLVQCFDGLPTPFILDDQIRNLRLLVSDLNEDDIRTAMNKMLSFGIFENRRGYPGEWRAGRLYKSALRMKYSRS
jgi:MinD-like ATPase involved in chromosome partitioning or flagellar assembly